MSEPRSTQERFCWNCGASMGRIERKYYDSRDTCGEVECNRAAADAERAERDEAHRKLDERMG